MNTLFDYLYRDASNYKEWGRVILSGEITPEQKERFVKALQDGEWFTPDQLKVPSVFLYPKYSVNDDDHGYHEFVGFEPTDSEPTDSRTVEEFVRQAEMINTTVGWNPVDPSGW